MRRDTMQVVLKHYRRKFEGQDAEHATVSYEPIRETSPDDLARELNHDSFSRRGFLMMIVTLLVSIFPPLR